MTTNDSHAKKRSDVSHRIDLPGRCPRCNVPIDYYSDTGSLLTLLPCGHILPRQMHERVYDSPTEYRPAIAETYPELVQAYASQGLRGPLPALDRPSTSQQVLSTAVTCGATAALALGLSWAAARLVAWSVAAAVPATLVATLLTLAGLQYVARPLGDRVAGIRREVPVRAGR